MKRGPGVAAVAALVVTVVSLAVAGLAPAGAASKPETPSASDVGVTADAIHIAIVADVDNPLAPNLFEGARYGVEGAAKYLNSKAGGGGVNGRKLVVDFIDSQLNANKTRNAVISACENDFAMVGTSMVFLTSADDLTHCPDKTGAATGLPDMPSFTAGVVESCAPTVYGLNPPQLHCDTATSAPQTYTSSKMAGPWFVSKFGRNKLHGLMVYGTDSKDAERSSRAELDAFMKSGIKADQYVGVSATTPQTGYTGFVQKMKADGSNVVSIVGGQPSSLRAEMQLQGMNVADVAFLCGCYAGGDKFTSDPALDGVYIWGYTLPFEEASSNAMLRTFVKYVPTDKQDGFAEFAWAATLAFAQAAETTMKQHGVNGLTRANFLKDGVTSLTRFDAGGMMGAVDIAQKLPTNCTMILQLVHAKYLRRFPTKKGTFDCKPSNLATFQADYIGG
jgi:hypothetical protein